ncbi:MAG TPA: MFS transporter [Chloroflexota bacterium]|nr:MFS transporter [Chloroflexota bacterium]
MQRLSRELSSSAQTADAQPSHIPGQIGRPLVFWVGVGLIALGVMAELFDFSQAHALGITVSQRGFTPLAEVGLTSDVVGMLLAGIGLLPAGWRPRQRPVPSQDPSLSLDAVPVPDLDYALVKNGSASQSGSSSTLLAMDSAKLSGTHGLMLVRLFIGLVLDTMKPATLGFMLPGMRAEYGVSAAEVSVFPVMALLGTTLGSVLFGYLGDVIGRRASFILTAILLAATSVCGLMPAFGWHLFACFMMGLAAGGELPLIYSMLAETMPAKHRGWLSVAIGGVGGLAGLLAASGLAFLLEPAFSWRVLWLPNLPTALFMLFLLKWIPESPRYLMLRGFHVQAQQAMAMVGVRLDTARVAALSVATTARKHSPREVFGRGMRGTTLTLCSYGVAWGLVNWGFITWLPTMLRGLGLDAAATSGLLATAAFFALPGTAAAAALFAFWSSKKSTVLFGAATCIALVGFGLGQPFLVIHPEFLGVALIALLVASSSMSGVLAPYSVELYPTALRGIGSGMVTASSKVGGVVGPTLIGVLLTLSPGLMLPSLVIATPIGLASVLMAWRAAETRGKRLEELTEEGSELGRPLETTPALALASH